MTHEHKPTYVGFRYAMPSSLLELAHLSLRSRILVWKCVECHERLEGKREEEMIVTEKPVFRQLASERFGVGHKYDRIDTGQKGQTTL